MCCVQQYVHAHQHKHSRTHTRKKKTNTHDRLLSRPHTAYKNPKYKHAQVYYHDRADLHCMSTTEILSLNTSIVVSKTLL